jgi:small-conductance mechanosensitive channel
MNLSPAWDTLERIWDGGVAALPNLVVALVVFGSSLVAGRLLRSAVYAVNERAGRRQNLGLVLGRLAQAGAILLGLLVGLIIVFPTFTPGDLLGLLGIGSVAIGFAFRDILQNFLAGILILLTEPFRIDDQIVFGPYEGTVEDIHTRATTIRTYDGRRVVIPNAELFTNPVTVNTAFDKRRLEYELGIGYGDDIDTAKRLIVEAMRGVEGVLAEPAPDALVVALAESSVTIRARWWIMPPRRADALDLQDGVIVAIKETLLAHGVDLPFPTRQILFHDQTEETDGDRARQREGWPAGAGGAPRPRTIAGALRRLVAQGEPNGRARPPSDDAR